MSAKYAAARMPEKVFTNSNTLWYAMKATEAEISKLVARGAVLGKRMKVPKKKSERRHKYNAKPTVVNGIRFPSKHEAKRYGELLLLERAGKISDLELQPEFVLHALGGGKVGVYRADFRYVLLGEYLATPVVEDAKGFRKIKIYKWKVKHLLLEYGIKVVEV